MNFGDVEHIKPKDAFPQLEFEWSNLGYVCDRCNNAKGNKYNVALEFIDPYSEDPAVNLVAAGALLWAKNGSERGEWTIAGIALNRPDLIERRDARIKSLDLACKAACRTKDSILRGAAIAELKNELLSDKEFAFIVAAFLNAALTS